MSCFNKYMTYFPSQQTKDCFSQITGFLAKPTNIFCHENVKLNFRRDVMETNAEKVKHSKGRLLDQAVIFFICVPFQNGNLMIE